ncbi:MAG: ABC transporter permease subunit [Candidatus Latescibacteria bacterium]|jgi:ABC-type transport system involved in multi-copper enzyme maturation permease subunit|nr:ABC transporter permease subunit [Candidatus Latescibacterota bacterium]
MLGTIIVREIQEYIKSKKFLIGLLVTIFLVTLSTVINIEDFQRRNNDYHTALQLSKSLFIKVYRPPQVLSIFAQGKDRIFGTTVTLMYGKISTITTGYMGVLFDKDNQLGAGFSTVDFSFIVKIVLSLLVIFFAYNSISGEKANGTLKMVLANRVPRDTMILGKCIGGLFVIILSLLIALIFSLLIIVLHPAVSLGIPDWIRIFGMFGVSALYLAVFYIMSFFISVMVNRPSTALIVLLQLWLFLTVIYPNATVIIVKKWYSVSSEEELYRRKYEPTKEIQELNDRIKELRKTGNREQSRQLSQKIREMRGNELAVRNYQIDSEFRNELHRQAECAQNIAILSPSVLYDKIMIRLAKTGMAEFEKFIDALLPYYRMLLKSELFSREADSDKLPIFSYSTEKAEESFFVAASDVLVLFLFGTVFFVLSYAAFLKKDVR